LRRLRFGLRRPAAALDCHERKAALYAASQNAARPGGSWGETSVTGFWIAAASRRFGLPRAKSVEAGDYRVVIMGR